MMAWRWVWWIYDHDCGNYDGYKDDGNDDDDAADDGDGKGNGLFLWMPRQSRHPQHNLVTVTVMISAIHGLVAFGFAAERAGLTWPSDPSYSSPKTAAKLVYSTPIMNIIFKVLLMQQNSAPAW